MFRLRKMHVLRPLYIRLVYFKAGKSQHMVKYWLSGEVFRFAFFISHQSSSVRIRMTFQHTMKIYEFSIHSSLPIRKLNVINMQCTV